MLEQLTRFATLLCFAAAANANTVAIVDANGFDEPIAAATVVLSPGWQTSGGVVWGTQYFCTNGYNFDWSATWPDGSATVAVLPQQIWEWNNYGAPSASGCPLARITTVTQALAHLVQSWRPGARVMEHRPRPDLASEYASLQSVTPMPMGEARSWVEPEEIVFSFDDRGRAMRGTIAAVVYFTRLSTGTMEASSGTMFPAWGAAAPAVAHDARLYETIRRSLETLPQWSARITGHNTQIARVNAEESRKRSEIVAQTNAEIARIREETWASSQASADRRARDFLKALRGVEAYVDPFAPGGIVELPNTHEYAWRLSDGSYTQTNDPYFDPWRELKMDGHRLERAP